MYNLTDYSKNKKKENNQQITENCMEGFLTYSTLVARKPFLHAINAINWLSFDFVFFFIYKFQ